VHCAVFIGRMPQRDEQYVVIFFLPILHSWFLILCSIHTPSCYPTYSVIHNRPDSCVFRVLTVTLSSTFCSLPASVLHGLPDKFCHLFCSSVFCLIHCTAFSFFRAFCQQYSISTFCPTYSVLHILSCSFCSLYFVLHILYFRVLSFSACPLDSFLHFSVLRFLSSISYPTYIHIFSPPYCLFHILILEIFTSYEKSFIPPSYIGPPYSDLNMLCSIFSFHNGT
jgi:hypothetical protein